MTNFDTWTSNPEESHGPLMSAVTWSLVSVAGGFLCVRLWIRQHQGKLWFDDCTLLISWVSGTRSRGKDQLIHIVQFLLLVQVIINQISINMGYGKHTLDRKSPKQSRTLHATDV